MDKIPPAVWYGLAYGSAGLALSYLIWFFSTRKYEIKVAVKTGKRDQPIKLEETVATVRSRYFAIRRAGRLVGRKRSDYSLAVCYQDNIYDLFSHDRRM